MRFLQTIAIIAIASVGGMLVSHTSLSKRGSGEGHGSHKLDAGTKKEIFQALDDYMSTFNARDLEGWERTYQFPHYRLASGEMSVLDRAGLRDAKAVFGALERTGWHHSRWEHRNVVHASNDKVHVDTQFSRFDAKGNLLGVYESLYILTKENGRWGVKMRSSYAE